MVFNETPLTDAASPAQFAKKLRRKVSKNRNCERSDRRRTKEVRRGYCFIGKVISSPHISVGMVEVSSGEDDVSALSERISVR